MTPRLTSSKKWTAIPPELCGQIRDVFTENFAEVTKNGQIFVDGRIFAQEMLLQVGFLPKGRLRQANFEVSIDFDPKKQNALELIHLAVDCAASMLEQYFESDEDIDTFPLEWKSYKIENRTVYVQASTINTTLEAEANRLLGVESDDLVQGEDIEAEIEITEKAVVSMLGLDRNDDDLPIDEEAPTETQVSDAPSATQTATKAKKPKKPLH